MSLNENLWYVGAQFMTSIQTGDQLAARRQLDVILAVLAQETAGHFSHFKLRALQHLTNANRAAFAAGASTDLLAEHSQWIIAHVAHVRSKQRLIALVREAIEKTISLVPRRNAYHDRVVSEAVEYIKNHYNEDITRDELASRLGRSSAHFSRLFSRTTGYSYKDFLLQCRLEKAKELLRQSHLQIAEIACAVGYQDAFQFSKLFHSRVGVSPRRYRESRMR